MLKPKGCMALILSTLLAFFLLSSSIVSSSMMSGKYALATSEGEGEDGSGNSEAGQEDDQDGEISEDGGEEQQDEGQQVDGVDTEPLLGDIPPEVQPQEGNQPVACSGVVNPETGECEEVGQSQDGSVEICDNSVDDDLDGAVDLDDSDCSVAEGQEANVPTLGGSDALPGESTDWGLPQNGITDSSNGNTGIPSFGPTPDTEDTTTSTSQVPSFSPLTDSGTEGPSEATESISREGMMPSQPPPSPPTYTGPGDLAPPPSPDDPDFCLKEFGRMQITGGTRSPQCMPAQSTNGPPAPTDTQQPSEPVICYTASDSIFSESGSLIFVADQAGMPQAPMGESTSANPSSCPPKTDPSPMPIPPPFDPTSAAPSPGGDSVDFSQLCEALTSLTTDLVLANGCDSLTQPTIAPDSDRDGIPDTEDKCPGYYTLNNDDRDRDGIGDECDTKDVRPVSPPEPTPETPLVEPLKSSNSLLCPDGKPRPPSGICQAVPQSVPTLSTPQPDGQLGGQGGQPSTTIKSFLQGAKTLGEPKDIKFPVPAKPDPLKPARTLPAGQVTMRTGGDSPLNMDIKRGKGMELGKTSGTLRVDPAHPVRVEGASGTVDPSTKKPHFHGEGEWKPLEGKNTGMHGAPSKVHTFLNTAQKIGKVAGTVGTAASVYSIGKETYDGYQKGGAYDAVAAGARATARESAGVAGAAALAPVLATKGAAYGFAVAGPWGAAVGGLAGGLVGGGLGYYGAAKTTETVIDYARGK